MTPLVGRLFDALDQRVGVRPGARAAAGKVFPAHWSFLLGEVALVAFGVLVATGIFLTFFYRPTVDPVAYEGTSTLYQGRTVPAVFDSILRLSHDVPGGLLMRRLHRAASHLFIAAVLAHLLRILLTGAFRRPREVNHLVGSTLLALVVAQGYVGHNLPWTVLSGTSLRITYTFMASIPWVGPQVASWVFGGDFPGSDVLPRMYVVHVVVLPLLIAGLVGVHLIVITRQSHTQRPRDGIDAVDTVVGEPMWPSQVTKSTTMALGLVSVLAASAVLVPWSDVALHGPYVVGHAVNASQPDWFLMWVEGGLRLYPGIDLYIPGGAVTGPFVVGILFPLLWFLLIALYPFLERRFLDEPGDHHALQHPFDVPGRIGLIAAAVTLIVVLTVAAADDVIARQLSVPVEAVVIVLRVLLFALPPAVGLAVAAYARTQPRRWVEPASADTDAGAGTNTETDAGAETSTNTDAGADAEARG